MRCFFCFWDGLCFGGFPLSSTGCFWRSRCGLIWAWSHCCAVTTGTLQNFPLLGCASFLLWAILAVRLVMGRQAPHICTSERWRAKLARGKGLFLLERTPSSRDHSSLGFHVRWWEGRWCPDFDGFRNLIRVSRDMYSIFMFMSRVAGWGYRVWVCNSVFCRPSNWVVCGSCGSIPAFC